MCRMDFCRDPEIAGTSVADYDAEAAVERPEGALERDGNSVSSELAGTRT